MWGLPMNMVSMVFPVYSYDGSYHSYGYNPYHRLPGVAYLHGLAPTHGSQQTPAVSMVQNLYRLPIFGFVCVCRTHENMYFAAIKDYSGQQMVFPHCHMLNSLGPSQHVHCKVGWSSVMKLQTKAKKWFPTLLDQDVCKLLYG